jgi:hypothetical protein
MVSILPADSLNAQRPAAAHFPPPLALPPEPHTAGRFHYPPTLVGTLKARARVTLAGAIIACVALGTLLLLLGIFDERAGTEARRGGTGKNRGFLCVGGGERRAQVCVSFWGECTLACAALAMQASRVRSRFLSCKVAIHLCWLPCRRRAQGRDSGWGVPANRRLHWCHRGCHVRIPRPRRVSAASSCRRQGRRRAAARGQLDFRTWSGHSL